MIEIAPRSLSRAPGDGIHRAFVSSTDRVRFLICAVAGRITVPIVHDHGRIERVGFSVVAVDQHRSLVRMTVTGKNEVYTALFENRQGVLSHVAQAAATVPG